MAGELPADFARARGDAVAAANAKAETVATRKASQLALEAFAPALPETARRLGRSHAARTSRIWQGRAALRRQRDASAGRHINYGVREFGMAAIMNGIALHGGFIPFGGTFLTFTDYSRNAIRMAALMKLRVIHVFTHDSIGLGEDGPTHQSVEHAASLRLIPNIDVWRPCDTVETAVAWSAGARAHGTARPRCSCRARTCRSCRASDAQIAAIARGGYVLAEAARRRAAARS